MRPIDKELFDAVERHNFIRVRAALENGADVYARDYNGKTALNSAVVYSTWSFNFQIIKLLIRYGANIDAKDNKGKTTLICASKCDELETVKFLLDYGADVNAKDNKGKTALINASIYGRLKIVESLTNNGADVNAKDKCGYRALMYASIKGYQMYASTKDYLEIVKFFIDNGVNINAKEHFGRTALIDASIYGYLVIVESLTNNGADVNAKDKEGKTALINASSLGRLKIVESLINNGADVNAKDKEGKTALINASIYGRLKIVESLINNGADVNAKDNNGDTALIEASKKGYQEIVESLINNGADVNAKDNNGDTALIHASIDGNLKIVESLIDNGANINAKDNKDSTALMYASKKLVSLEAAMKAKYSFFSTALLCDRSLEMVKFLTDNGADVNAKDAYGKTALMYASDKGETEIVKLLRYIETKQQLEIFDNFYFGNVIGNFIFSPINNYLKQKLQDDENSKSLFSYYFDQFKIDSLAKLATSPILYQSFSYFNWNFANSMLFTKMTLDGATSLLNGDYQLPTREYVHKLLSFTISSYSSFYLYNKLLYSEGFDNYRDKAVGGFLVAFVSNAVDLTSDIIYNKFPSHLMCENSFLPAFICGETNVSDGIIVD